MTTTDPDAAAPPSAGERRSPLVRSRRSDRPTVAPATAPGGTPSATPPESVEEWQARYAAELSRLVGLDESDAGVARESAKLAAGDQTGELSQ